jgi:hypothetical protein
MAPAETADVVDALRKQLNIEPLPSAPNSD